MVVLAAEAAVLENLEAPAYLTSNRLGLSKGMKNVVEEQMVSVSKDGRLGWHLKLVGNFVVEEGQLVELSVQSRTTAFHG